MGSKRLKAVAVRGSGTIRVAAPEAFMEAVAEAWHKLENSAATGRRRQWGTIWSGSVLNDFGLFPSRNFQDDHIDPEIATRLGPPPKGYANWTLRLLARKVIELEIVDEVSYETIRRTLKQTA